MYFYPRLTLDGLFRRFVEAGEDGEGEGGDGEEEDEPDLDQEVAASCFIFTIVTVGVDEGDNKRRKSTQVEEGGEDGEDQESPLLALVGAAGSGHA